MPVIRISGIEKMNSFLRMSVVLIFLKRFNQAYLIKTNEIILKHLHIDMSAS